MFQNIEDYLLMQMRTSCKYKKKDVLFVQICEIENL